MASLSTRIRLVSVLSVLLPAVACGTGGEAPSAPPPPEVSYTEVEVRDVPIYGEWLGETRGRADIEIRARVQGFLEGIHFREGGKVKKGQLLYTVDKSELLQELNAATATLAAAETELAYAVSDVARYKPLAEINAVSQRDLDSAVARHDAAESQVEAAKAILELSQINLSYAEIKSPMNGVIGLSKAKVGDYVGQNPNPIVLNTVSDTDPIHVRYPLGERQYLEMARRYPLREKGGRGKRDAEQIELELYLADGTVHPYTGRALFIERNIDASTGTVMVEATFPNPDLVLRPGQYGRVKAIVDRLENALLVPQRAVQELQGQFQVWVAQDDGTVELRQVKMGTRVDNMWVVEAGLDPGERVVVEGIQRLRNGIAITAQPWEPDAMAVDPAPEG